jgi:hypothetical protein
MFSSWWLLIYLQIIQRVTSTNDKPERGHGSARVLYQAMFSLSDVPHDGWFCTFTIKQQLEIPSARSWAAPVRATCKVRIRQAFISGSLSSSQSGGPPCLASPLAFGLIGTNGWGEAGDGKMEESFVPEEKYVKLKFAITDCTVHILYEVQILNATLITFISNLSPFL